MLTVSIKVERECRNCTWWQDYTNRVYACISKGHSSMARNMIQLRACKFIPHPSSSLVVEEIYTDETYCCGEFREVGK